MKEDAGVDELYEYMKEKIAGVSAGEEISIDTAHAFRMFQMVCFMKQIREIIKCGTRCGKPRREGHERTE